MTTNGERTTPTCAKCGTSVQDSQPGSLCPRCKDETPAGLFTKLERAIAGEVSSLTGTPKDLAAPLSRYRDAYKIANETVATGKIVRTIGVILGGLGALIGLMALGNGALGAAFGLLIMIVGVSLGVVCFAIGTHLAAQGQHLLASLDTAVCVSPFLSNDQRASVMGLR